MTLLQIRPADVDRVTHEFTRGDVRADDEMACLLALRDEHKARRLNGDWQEYRIRAWDQRRGWIEHRPSRP